MSEAGGKSVHLGYCAPLVVAIFAIPLLIKGLGTDRFGVLTLAWVLIGYLSLFDLGLSRALTKLLKKMISALRMGLNRWLAWSERSVNRRIFAAMMTVGGLTFVVKLAAAAKEVVVAHQFLWFQFPPSWNLSGSRNA